MKKTLLIGFGSEIGSMLLYLNKPYKDNFFIDTVITNKITSSAFQPIESLKARLVLLNPDLINEVYILDENNILIRNKKIKIIWADIKKFNFGSLKKYKFFASIIATSKKDISNKELIVKLKKISKFVFGVAESKNYSSYYHNLNKSCHHFSNTFLDLKERYFALGSCQSTGWTAQVKAFLDCMDNNRIRQFEIISNQLEIVHPDTPTGRLGTKSIDPRMQDPRDNFRPSFSQAKITMNKIFPNAKNISSISLRTLTLPPGFQITRFFFKYKSKNKLKKKDIINSLKKTEKNNKDVIKLSDLSLGSKAFEKIESSAVILTHDDYLTYIDDFISLKNEKISMLLMLSYIHNTRGYSRYVINSIKEFGNTKKKYFFNYDS